MAALAQLVEHRIRNAGVACSSHAGGTICVHILFPQHWWLLDILTPYCNLLSLETSGSCTYKSMGSLGVSMSFSN